MCVSGWMKAWGDTPKWLGWTQHRAVMASLILALAVEFFAVGPGSVLGRVGCRWPQYMGHILNGPGGVVVHDSRKCTQCRHGIPDSHEEIGQASIWHIDASIGFWFGTTRFRGSQLNVTHYGSDFSQQEAEDLVVRSALRDPSYAWLAQLPPNQPIQRSIIWSGLLLNAVALLMVAALGYGFFTRAQRTIRLERLASGRCPVCKYSIEGLPTDRCPECGSIIPAPPE